MTKTSPAKKRKKETCKEGTNKQSKKAKRTKKQQASDKPAGKAKKHLNDENIGQDQNHSGEEACTELEQGLDIDKELDKNASKSNLSVFNVKSIIHHVLSDERVLAMARNAAEDDDDGHNRDTIPEETHSVSPSIIEPKLTRSRVREVAQTRGTAPDPLLLVKETIIHSPLKNVVSPFKLKRKTFESINTPDKVDGGEREEEEKDTIPVVKLPLADINFSEGGSSDEEYDPLKDQSDGSEDDSESCVSNTSDLASPEPLRRTSRAKRRLLTDPENSSQPEDLHKSDEAAALKAAQEKELASPFKVPLPLSRTSDKVHKENVLTDLIATRTRSRLPLTDTSLETLEAQFIPPDLTPDLYDVIDLENLEQDDIDWHKWLFGLNKEKGATDTDDPEDAEYNFMAEDQKEEKEEYRTDRAVKISQKELAELFEEFLSEFGDDISMAGTDSLQFQSASADIEDIAMTLPQRQCLAQQLQKHTQLLVQVAVLCKEHPDLNFVSETCEGLLQDMVRLKDIASSNYDRGSMGAKQILPSTTVLSCVGLSEALRITSLPRSTSSPTATTSALKPGDESRETTASPPISEEVGKILMSSPIFIYTGLLPHVGFHTPKTGGRAEKFLQCEDNLLVLGIDQYGHDWVQIKKHYLPVKTLNQIKIRRKNLCSNRCQDNVVKQYKKTGKIPKLPTIPAVPATEERHRFTILPASSDVGTSPTWLRKMSEQQGIRGKKICRRKKSVKNMPIVSASSNDEAIPTIILKDATSNALPINDVMRLPLPAEASKESQFQNINIGIGKTFVRTGNSSSQGTVRTILPNLKPSPKEAQKIPTTVSLQNETLNRECSSPIVTSNAVTVDHTQSSILQGSEKENIQPASEVPLGGNVNDGNPENLRIDTSEDSMVRAVSFAQSYLNNVKDQVREDSPTYQAFLKVLVDSKSNTWSPAKLYEEIAVVLKDFPDLVRDFVGFLEPDQAVDAGVFMTNKEILNARIFLERLENHFQKNPAHFQKIIKAFSTFNLQESKPSQLYEAVIPLLKGQQHLIDEFNSFFDHLKPQPSNSDDFEEVELGSGSEVEVDDFEEVVIPDVKKSLAKTREFGKTLVKPSSRNISRKGRRVKKDDMNDKNVCENVIDYDKDRDEDITEDTIDRHEEMNGICDDMRDNGGKPLESDEDDEGYMDKVNSDSEIREVSHDNISLLTKYASDVSNPSSPGSECKSGDNDDPFDEDYMESPGTTQESQVTSASEAASDLSNEALDIPTTSNHSPVAQCENMETTEGLHKKPHSEANASHAKEAVVLKQEAEESSANERTCSTSFAEEVCAERSDKDECSFDLGKRISANNLELDEDGKSVIIWTREDDKKILQLCQTRSFSDNIYEEIAQELGSKTAAQVESRFHILVSLLPDDNVNSSSDQSGSESDDESCDETEEN